MKQFYTSIRFYLGGIALALGIIGLLLFTIGIPISIFQAHFWGGMGFREGPQPTPDQLQAAVNNNWEWSIFHRLVPLFVISVALIGYGFYEARKERANKP
jgi:hypothetical protein